MEMQPVINSETQLTDREVIERIIAGEHNLFEMLIRRYNARMYRVGIVIINNDSDIEDVMQNAYIKAFQGLCGFEFKSSFSTWLIRVLVNECLQYLKKTKKVTRLVPINEMNMYNGEISAGANTIPDRVALNKELGKALEESIIQLPEKYRTVFVMREIENMSTAETVEALDITETNVKVRLNRAKAILREKLDGYYKSDFLFHFYLGRCDRVTQTVMRSIEQ